MKPWMSAWDGLDVFPAGTPEWAVAASIVGFVYFFVIMPGAGFMAFLDRKISADLQARIGPNRVGLAGLFQPLADLLKLLQKEKRIVSGWREAFWLGLHTMALYSTVAVLPLGSMFLLVDTDMSAFMLFWAALILALGTMLMGLNQGSIPGWFGGIRVASQALAGAFPAMIGMICVGLRAGSFRWSAVAAAQGSSPLHWTVFSDPFQFIAFFVFLASGMVLLGISPLDGGLSVPDIHGGVSSHLYGRRLSLFRLGRFYGFFLWSEIAVVLFMGAWNLPLFVTDAIRNYSTPVALEAVELLVLLVKTGLVMLGVTWVARANPRIRADQITDMAWKVLSPLSLMALIGTTVWMIWVNH
ncbi:NADH-quinone oxidoreductase subunit H [bacterium]|jgi:NADH-quinone oxidoreductase subunit H|nr:NADH-quinone oxidoreductase subunit H [bacterium]